MNRNVSSKVKRKKEKKTMKIVKFLKKICRIKNYSIVFLQTAAIAR